MGQKIPIRLGMTGFPGRVCTIKRPEGRRARTSGHPNGHIKQAMITIYSWMKV